ASKLTSTLLKGLKLSPLTVMVPFSEVGIAAAAFFKLGGRMRKLFDVASAAAAGWKQPGVTVICAGERIALAGGPLCQMTKTRWLLWTSRPSEKVACTTSMPGAVLSAIVEPARPLLSVLAVLF